MSDRKRFSFGDNWSSYIKNIDEAQINDAIQSLSGLLGTDDLRGSSFLDLGCGSGIFSLAAARLGANSVHSVDADALSVEATNLIKERFAPEIQWNIEKGSILDKSFLSTLPACDFVYCWGVVHHTGDMWTAIDNVIDLVANRGTLVLAVYNDHWSSPYWLRYKQPYYRSGNFVRRILVGSLVLPRSVIRLLKGMSPVKVDRGMNVYHDVVAWAGGLPYEYADFDGVIKFCNLHGIALANFIPTTSTGCNQFVFQKE